MPKLKDDLLKLMQGINSVGKSLLIDYIKLDFIEKMETEAFRDDFFNETVNQLNIFTQKALANIEDYASLEGLKNKYSEAFIFSKLRALLVIDKVPESNTKTPDFCAKFRGHDIYLELKSLNIFGGALKHQEIMLDGLAARIDAETQIKSGNIIGIGVQIIDPYKKHGKNSSDGSPRLIIESLIDKINQNIKKDQYLMGDTILILDLSDQLPLLSTPMQSIQKNYRGGTGADHASGELWHVAFGKLGEEIYRPTHIDGIDHSDGMLEKQGILIEHRYIKGIAFHVNGLIYSLSEIRQDTCNTQDLLEYISQSCKCEPQQH
jgi:hypothetical protein